LPGHSLARLTQLSWQRLISRHSDEGVLLRALAAKAGISLGRADKWLASFLDGGAMALADPGLIQSQSQALLLGMSAWVEVGGIAPSLCLKAPPLQPISI
jgi:hypothetical protein